MACGCRVVSMLLGVLLACCRVVAVLLACYLPCCWHVICRVVGTLCAVLLACYVPCCCRVVAMLFAMLLPCCCHVVGMLCAVLLPCCCRVAAVLLPCCCRVVAVLLPCQPRNISTRRAPRSQGRPGPAPNPPAAPFPQCWSVTSARTAGRTPSVCSTPPWRTGGTTRCCCG